MQDKGRWRTVSVIIKALCLQTLFVFCSLQSNASPFVSNVQFLSETPIVRRDELTAKLRAITGWRDLRFDETGALRLGNELPVGGSEGARRLLMSAASGEKVIALEDASNRRDVVFCNVSEARWSKDAVGKPPAYLILIDFADFSLVSGHRPALDAFNSGWAVLHEMEHVISGSVDPMRSGEAGECESAINQMRRECGVAERADYHFGFLPGAGDGHLPIKLVRLAFEQRQPNTNKKKRYWLVWDANLVGGLKDRALIAGFR